MVQRRVWYIRVWHRGEYGTWDNMEHESIVHRSMVHKSTVRREYGKQKFIKHINGGSWVFSFDCYSGVLNVPSSSRLVKAPGVLLILQTIIISGERDHGSRLPVCGAPQLPHVIIFSWRSSVSPQSATWLILSFLCLMTGKWILIEEVMAVAAEEQLAILIDRFW